MNIDDLKDAWNQDEPKGVNLPDSTAHLGKTNSAVTSIRKNMKSEFIATLISYVIISMFLFVKPQISLLYNTGCILFFTILLLNTYYFSKFYVLYKSIGRYDLNMRDSIRKIVYELELNIEIYKTYNFSLAPLAVMVTVTLTGSKWMEQILRRVLASNAFMSLSQLFWACGVILISFLITYLCIGMHVRNQFGRYIAGLKQVMDDLGSDI